LIPGTFGHSIFLLVWLETSPAPLAEGVPGVWGFREPSSRQPYLTHSAPPPVADDFRENCWSY